jgi:hypothetical protein
MSSKEGVSRMALNGWELSEGVRLKPLKKGQDKCRKCQRQIRQGQYIFYAVKHGRAVPFDFAICRQRWLELYVGKVLQTQQLRLLQDESP